jgi:predicted patatin/cPLA2 family phospholipase
MGFMKSMKDLQKQGSEMQKNMDVGGMMSNAQEQMAAATQMMADQTAAANVALNGQEATATITAVRATGTLVNYQPAVELDLTVFMDGRPPYPATVTQVVPVLAQAVAGANLHVKVDPQNPTAVWIDWTKVS